jgi:integrase
VKEQEMAKKRINGEGTVWYVASEKRYRAQYPAGGKRRTISGKTRREVELKLRDALAKRDTNTLEKSRKESDTVEDFLLFWVSAKTPGWQFKTIERVNLDINKFIIPEIGSVKLCDLTAEMIERAYVNIMKKHGISDSSLLHVHSTLRTALARASKLKRIAVNPMLSVETPKQRKFYASPLTMVEWRKLMQAAQMEPTMWHLMWRLTLATGLRQGEVLGIGWEDFNSDTGGVFVRNQLQRQTGNGLVLKSILKANAEPREIVLDEETAALMKVWRKEQTQYRLQKGSWGEKDLVFTNSLGKPIEPRKALTRWKELLRHAGIKERRLHDARHTFATVLLQSGVEVKVVSHYLGHSDVRTTQNIYQHVNTAILNQTAKMIGELAI